MTTPQPPTQTPPTPPNPEPTWRDTLAYPLGALGAFVGAALGALIVHWAWQSHFYTIPAVGLLAGWAAAFFARKPSLIVGLLAGLVAGIVGIWAEWKFIGPMILDGSFQYFLKHITEIGNFKLVIHGISIAIAVWFGARK